MEFIAQEPDPAVVDDFTLISVQNRGGKMTPNSATVELCNSAEKTIRSIDKLDPNVIKCVKALTLTYVVLNIIHTNFTCVSYAKLLLTGMLSLELSTRPQNLF